MLVGMRMLLALAAVYLSSEMHVSGSVNEKGVKKKKRAVRQKHQRSKSCTLVEGVALKQDENEQASTPKDTPWFCISEDEEGTYYEIKSSKNFFRKYGKDLVSGETTVTFQDKTEKDHDTVAADAIASPYTMEIPSGATISQRPKKRRRNLVQLTGTSTVLAVRVLDIFGKKPSMSAAQLSDDIFGTDGDPHNLVSQYAACSNGKLNLVPGTGNNVVNGVVDITLPYSVSRVSFTTVQNWVSSKFQGVVGKNLADFTHVLYILPPDVDMPFAGYAYYHNYLSLYKDMFATHLIVLLHEIGHNLGLRHSGEGRLEYADSTCMMGSSLFKDDAPQMCFNGAKSFSLGWYSDRHVVVTPSTETWSGNLVGIDDYNNGQINAEDQYVVAKLVGSQTELFLMYNRGEGVNEGVVGMADTVTVVEQHSTRSTSWLLAGLTEKSEPFRYEGWNGMPLDLVIHVCERRFGSPDYARVIAYLDDDGDSSHSKCADAPPIQPVGKETGVNEIILRVSHDVDDYAELNSGKVNARGQGHTLWSKKSRKLAYRFANVPIPQGATILEARLEMMARGKSHTGNALSGVVRGEAIGNAIPLERGSRQISKARKTRATVHIKGLPTWNADEYNSLGDVAAVIQEVVDRSDYKAGNAIKLFLLNRSSRGARKVKTHESGAGARLIVRFE